MQRDVDDARQYAVQKFARDVVEAAENLRRGLASLPPADANDSPVVTRLREGFESVERSFLGILERNGITGMDADGCDRCVIAGNRIADNDGRGLFFGGGSGARIEGNTVTGNRSDGIDVEDSDTKGNLFRGNRLTGNGGSGIEVSAVNNRFEGNTATGNDTDGSGEADLVDLNLEEGFFFPDPAPGCVNTWRGNRFVTDNEDGAAFGPGAGCIR